MGENATLALSVGLAIAGTVFLGPGGAQLGMFAGQMIGGAFFEDGPPNQLREGPRLTDTAIVTASYGHAIPWTFGRDRVACKMIFGTEIKETRIENTFGGKGGPEITTVVYTYTVTAAFLACRGVQHIEKVFFNKRIFYQQPNGDTGDFQFDELPTKRIYYDSLRFYSGSETQNPDPAIVEELGATRAPAFRGLCYLMCDELPLAEFGNRIPFIEVITSPNRAPIFPIREVTRGGNPSTGMRAAFFTPDTKYYVRKSNGGSVLDVWDPATQSRVRTVSNQTGYSLGLSQTFFGIDSRYNMYVGNELDVDGFATGTIIDSNFELVGAIPELGLVHEILLWDDDEYSLDGNRVRFTSVFRERPMPLGREVHVAWLNTFRIGTPPRQRFAITQTNYSINPLTGGESVTTTTILSVDNIVDYIAGQVIESGGPAITGTWVGEWMTVDTLRSQIWVDFTGAEGHALCRIGTDGVIKHLFYSASLPTHEISYFENCDSILFLDSGSSQLYDIDLDAIVDTDIGGRTGDINESGMYNGPLPDGRMMIATGDTSAVGFYVTRGSISITGSEPRHLGGQNILTWVDGDGVILPVGDTYENTDYDWQSHAIIRHREGGNVVWWFLDRYTWSGNTNLKTIVDAVCAEVGLVTGELDTTDLAGTDIIGFTIGQRMSARSVLDLLRAAFQFDAAEIDYKLKFQHRSSASLVRTLGETRLGFGRSKGPVVHGRGADLEIPQRVEVIYRDEERDFQNNLTQYKRGDISTIARDQTKIELPINLTDRQAKDAAEYLLNALWCERSGKNVVLSQHDLDITPMDIIAYSLDDGHEARVYMQDVGFGRNGIIECKGVLEDPELQISAVLEVNSQTPGPGRQVIDIAGLPSMAVMDTVMLQDNDGDSPHLYLAAGVASGAFPGFEFRRQVGIDIFRPYHFRTRDEGATMGLLPSVGTLNASVRWTVWDRTNTFTVVVNGTLTSSTESLVLDGANALMVGSEVIQFVNATLVSTSGGNSREYTLDTLLRGRRGTEYALGTHVASETVVVLTAGTVGIQGYSLSDAENANVFRGTDLNGNRVYPDLDLTLMKNNMKPLAPVGLYGSRNGDDVDVTWRRRTRMAGVVDWNAGVPTPPLNEDSENYEIVLIESGVEVLTLTSTVPSRTITAAEQEQAFGSSFQPTLSYFNAAVYQMSGLVGRGFISDIRQLPNVEL